MQQVLIMLSVQGWEGGVVSWLVRQRECSCEGAVCPVEKDLAAIPFIYIFAFIHLVIHLGKYVLGSCNLCQALF